MVVTISNQYGTGALSVAKHAADALGYEYVDRQLPVVVAKRLNVTPDDVDASEDTARSLGERFLSGLELATPQVAQSAEPFGEELLRGVQEAVREYASHGSVIIVGRGAGAFLGARPDVLRVFMHAPRDWRIEHIVAGLSVDRKTAETEVDRIDKARAAYLREWYSVTFGDPADHDLCIDTSRFTSEESAEVIVAAVRARSR